MSNAVIGKRSGLALVVVERVVVRGADLEQLVPRGTLGCRNRRQQRHAGSREVPEAPFAQVARDEVLNLRDNSPLHFQAKRELDGLVGFFQDSYEPDLTGDRIRYVDLERRRT